VPASLLREFDPDAPADQPPAQTAGQSAIAMMLTALLLGACLLLALGLSVLIEFPID
jgi:hypothetical protein